jgi:hypothetical protein
VRQDGPGQGSEGLEDLASPHARRDHQEAVRAILGAAGIPEDRAEVEHLLVERPEMIEQHARLHARLGSGAIDKAAYAEARRRGDLAHMDIVASILGPRRFARAKAGFRAYRRSFVAGYGKTQAKVARPAKPVVAKQPREEIRERARRRAAEVAALVESGVTQSDVARSLGISRQRVHALLAWARSTGTGEASV